MTLHRNCILLVATLLFATCDSAPKDITPPPVETTAPESGTPEGDIEATRTREADVRSAEAPVYSQDLVVRLEITRTDSRSGRQPTQDHQRFTLEGSRLSWHHERTGKPAVQGERALTPQQRDDVEALIRTLGLDSPLSQIHDATGEEVLNRSQMTLSIELEGALHQTTLSGALYRAGDEAQRNDFQNTPRFRDVMHLFSHLKRLQT